MPVVDQSSPVTDVQQAVPVAQIDWGLIAKAAGEHGVRYRTNRAMLGFLAAIEPARLTPIEGVAASGRYWTIQVAIPEGVEAQSADRMRWYFGHAIRGYAAKVIPLDTDPLRLMTQAVVYATATNPKPTPPATSPEGKSGDGVEAFLDQLRRVNTDRYHAWVGDGEDAGILFDAAELGGEVGELLNVVKKLEREERGWRGSRAAPEDFADECADVLICLDKLARRKGVNLAAATVAKFNATSEKVDLPHRLAIPDATQTREAEGEVPRLTIWGGVNSDATIHGGGYRVRWPGCDYKSKRYEESDEAYAELARLRTAAILASLSAGSAQ